MTDELETVVREMFAGVDRKDFEAVMRVTDENAQGIDETSRRWLRTRDDVLGRWREGLSGADDVHTELRDVHEEVFGDVGLLTCWLEQDFRHEGRPEHLSGPATFIFRRREDGWRLVLFHPTALPEGEAQST